MKKIFIEGYYGENNLGDDYILYSLLKNLCSQGKYRIIVLANKKGKATCEEIKRNVGNKKIRFYYFKHKTVKILKTFFGLLFCNRYILGGGGLFPQENLGNLKRRLWIFKLSNFLKAKNYLFGIGINSISLKDSEIMWKQIIDACLLCVTRDNYSYTLLSNIDSIDKYKIKHSYDLTFGFVTKAELASEDYKILDKKYIIWSLAMPFSNEEMKLEHYRNRFAKLCSAILFVIDSFSGEYTHVFLPFYGGNDLSFINEITTKMQSDNYIVINGNYPLDKKRLLFKDAEFAIDMRFHSVMFSLYYATPFCAISYSPKITEILNELNLIDHYIEYGVRDSEFFYKETDLNENEFMALIRKNFENRLKDKQKLQLDSNLLKEVVNRTFYEFCDFIK